MAEGWQRKFRDGPIDLPDGRSLVTLKDAGDYITKLPKKESALPVWQAAIHALMLCSEGADTMLARIGVLKALKRNEPDPPPAPRRKAAKKFKVIR
ncbi:hypothetical protein FFI89_018675 [Bradyrhizobium sp. KBS0727]|uniref:hypothetical protein n=1 Tax=unclassified Bradyrhizobium TaxID=2631580 RepID=UPI00110E30D0|nr:MULTISPECIES: hypothetical protein [unclassified Bradyrhizobium]QDW38991.1 hypothetical protein FFI71_018675 [Bradyrhizobium sp. KBS0725]QDW45594.1 hypothetical protein FFI89_018675 [Bradyrhizobium sp. KBS0727]